MALTPDIYRDDFFPADAIDEETGEVTELEDAPEPSLTWRINYETGRIEGMIDEVDAIKQFAQKALSTARSRFLIYSDDYGSELAALIGADVTRGFLDAELPRIVSEALIYDDRVTDVTDITWRMEGDALFISLTLVTVFGDVETEVFV